MKALIFTLPCFLQCGDCYMVRGNLKSYYEASWIVIIVISIIIIISFISSGGAARSSFPETMVKQMKHTKHIKKVTTIRATITTMSTPGLKEKYSTPGKRERPLRLLLVGHNPSDKAWATNHYYANPSNRMWKLLSSNGIIPANYTAVDDDLCPHTCGVGFTDLGYGQPGTKSSSFKSAIVANWRESLFRRMKAHAERAGRPPQIIAFTGKRQFMELFYDDPSPKPPIAYGVQERLPIGWPFSRNETCVFVLTSSSGAAAMTTEQREKPYRELAALLSKLDPWISDKDDEI